MSSQVAPLGDLTKALAFNDYRSVEQLKSEYAPAANQGREVHMKLKTEARPAPPKPTVIAERVHKSHPCPRWKITTLPQDHCTSSSLSACQPSANTNSYCVMRWPTSPSHLPSDLHRVAGIDCQLELGQVWTRERIDSLLANTMAQSTDASDQLTRIVHALLGTPFQFESKLPIPARGSMRVRLESFDCVTFIYTVLAMCGAGNFEEFVRRLYVIRYRTENRDLAPDSDPDTGSIFDFACESLLENGVRRGFVAPITRIIGGNAPLTEFGVELKRFQRASVFDEQRRFVSPKLGRTIYRAQFLRPQQFSDIRIDEVRSGDIAILTRGERNKDGELNPTLVSHLVVVQKDQGQLNFVHATRNFAWRPKATSDTPSSFTGIFYDDQRRKEQIGVGFGGQYAGDEHTTRLGSDSVFGYDQDRRRTLNDYMGSSFVGALFLRPLWPANRTYL